MTYVICFFIILWILFYIIRLFPLSIPKFNFNPSALYTFYGAPGCGKSTLAAWFAKKAISSGIPVYCNFPVIGCRHFDKDDIGKFLMEDCLVILDEAGVDFNSRNFKSNFNKDQIKWFKYHRHERAMIMIFSQGFDDADKIIRTLSTDCFVVRRGFFNTITYRRIIKRPDIDEITHKPDDIYSFAPFSKKRIYARPVWKLFDSYSRLGLPDREWHIYEPRHHDTDNDHAQVA